jgi:Na+/proline symporter
MDVSMLASGDIKVAMLDIIVITVYFIGIVGIGLWAGRKRKDHLDSDSYFRAGGTLTWPMIGLALFSTNISTIHMVGFAGEGYRTGLAYGNFEWMAPFLLIVLALFFAPFYLKSQIATLPDFLQKRYCGTCRNWLAGLSIVSAVFIHIGFTLYTGALVIKTLFGIPIMTSIVAAAVLTGIYTVVGGLLAVVVTGALQTVILLAGSIILTIISLVKIGGWQGLVRKYRSGQADHVPPGRGPGQSAVVFGISGLSGHWPVVLVCRPDDSPACAGGQGRQPCTHRSAVCRIFEGAAGFYFLFAGDGLPCDGQPRRRFPPEQSG